MSAPIGEKAARSLPWFRVDVAMVDHPRVYALADELEQPFAGWYVVRLWAWTMRYAPTGRIAHGADSARAGRADGARMALERACDWRGEPGALVAAFERTGWLDPDPGGGWVVHDWDEHQGAAVAKAQKDAERKRGARKARAESADGAEAARVRRGDAAGNETRRDETKQKEREKPLSPGEAFFAWSQELRQKHFGLPPEKPPRDLSIWISEALMEVDLDRLKAGWVAFLKTKHWQSQGLPWSAWRKQWATLVPPAAPAEQRRPKCSHPSCESVAAAVVEKDGKGLCYAHYAEAQAWAETQTWADRHLLCDTDEHPGQWRAWLTAQAGRAA